MKLGIILSQAEPETVFNALRLANYSLKQGDTVKIFLVGKFPANVLNKRS